MASLSPSASMIIETTAREYISTTINAVGFSAVTSWSWTLTEVPSTPSGTEGRNIIISPDGMTLNVSYASDRSLFPIITIDYLMNEDSEQRASVLSFDDLPEDSSDVVKFQQDSKSWCDWTLQVTASGTDSQAFPVTVTETYDIRVYANYSIGRDALIAEVQKRYASSN